MKAGWHRAKIKAEIEIKGVTLRRLALDAGINPAGCRQALSQRHPPGEKAIAAFLGVPLWELWPDRWQKPASKGGAPIRIDKRFRKQNSENAIRRHDQSHKAA